MILKKWKIFQTIIIIAHNSILNKIFEILIKIKVFNFIIFAFLEKWLKMKKKLFSFKIIIIFKGNMISEKFLKFY